MKSSFYTLSCPRKQIRYRNWTFFSLWVTLYNICVASVGFSFQMELLITKEAYLQRAKKRFGNIKPSLVPLRPLDQETSLIFLEVINIIIPFRLDTHQTLSVILVGFWFSTWYSEFCRNLGIPRDGIETYDFVTRKLFYKCLLSKYCFAVW